MENKVNSSSNETLEPMKTAVFRNRKPLLLFLQIESLFFQDQASKAVEIQACHLMR